MRTDGVWSVKTNTEIEIYGLTTCLQVSLQNTFYTSNNNSTNSNSDLKTFTGFSTLELKKKKDISMTLTI